MSGDLLQTKLYVPRLRSDLVHRPHLLETLNHGLNSKLTLVSAPAGFGKTTLVGEWVTHLTITDSHVAWLSLDAADNDLARFLRYVVTAVCRSKNNDSPAGKSALAMLHSQQPTPTEAVLTSLINEIAAMPDRIILVLDDYHLVEAQPVHDALGFLLDNSPPQIHLVIATREDPPLLLSRFRARAQLTEIRAADLRFTTAEAADFLNRVMGLDLSPENIAALETRTEGWITGLQLAAISMQRSDESTRFIQSFTGSHHYVMDYLIEEVLAQQPDHMERFLVQTAVLDQLTGSLCNALTGRDDGQEMLAVLERANLFVIPLDEERQWYRYHHLFGDLLRRRLRRTRPEDLPILHKKASGWFKNQGLDQEAIKHSLAGKNYQHAAKLIEAIAFDMIQQGKHTTIVGWLNAFPEEILKEHAYMCVLHARTLQLTGDLENSEVRLIDAENALDSQAYQVDEISGLIHSCRAYSSFMIGDHDNTISHARQALDELPATAALLRVQTALYLGIAYRYRGELQAALDIYDEILPSVKSQGGHSISVLCYLHLGDLYTEMAQLQRAQELYEQALKSTEHHTGQPDLPFTGYIYVSMGRIFRQWNQLEDAYHLTMKGLTLCREWNVADILALSCLELAYIHQALGNVEQAKPLIQEAIQIFNSLSDWGSQLGTAHKAKFDLVCGDIESAERWADSNDLLTDDTFEFHREIEYLVLVRVFIAQKRLQKAHALVVRIQRIAKEIRRRQTELEALILQALILSKQGKTDQALLHLEKALLIGEPEGYIRIFVDEGQAMVHLLQQALSSGVAPDYVRRLLAAFPAEVSFQTAVSKLPIDQSGLIEPLSERELEILQKIAEGLTNPEIANRLYLSLNTVKVHTRNIYSKLDVHNRTQAVAKARDMGILPLI